LPYVCVHAHFYQPSREDPWTGVWPVEPTAAPWRDWNDRIADECYAPNAAARLLDEHGRLRGVVDNYAGLGFDVGPTLLQWLETSRPVVYRALLRADRVARQADGHGRALAQGYHHAILPLADARDRRTEIAWGLRDFELRYGRKAEGFWLPETAVDTPTLVELADQGVRFVLLAPHQLGRVRPPEGDRWLTPDEVPDLVRRPYVVRLPGDRRIVAFPYDGGLAHGIAFDGWLHDGADLGRRLVEAARGGGPDTLVHVATDGESYGHHHRHGEMALARALEVITADAEVDLVGHARYLELHPPTWQAEIVEQTSWSCAHGLERWRSDCGCNVGNKPGWHQRWRGPLRAAFDTLRDEARAVLAPVVSTLLRDPIAARDAYVDLLRDHADETFHAWFREHGASPHLSAPQIRRAHAALEIERHLLATYTSCGWFFDDATGIEARQNVRHAACALGLLREELGVDLHAPFLERLAALPSNKDPAVLVELVEEARRHPRPVRAPHGPSTLGALAEEGPQEPPVRPLVPPGFRRSAGLLLHVTALPGDGPVGDLDGAVEAIDWMVAAGLSAWQVLPLTPPDPHGSPYASWSSLSSWPGLVGLRPLVEAGLLTPEEIRSPEGPIGLVDLELVERWKLPLLRTAARRLRERPDHPWHADLDDLVVRSPWLIEAARFRAARAAHDFRPWWTWPAPLRRRDPAALDALDRDHAEEIFVGAALELFFDRQWQAVHTYASARGVRILGDLPIYVGHDSADVWADQDLFQLDPEGLPLAVAGVPPDAFSETGQRWGNPLYAWDRHAADGFRWWTRRLRRALSLTDVVRLDHFIGFVTYWSVPAGAPDARSGRWLDGPGRRLFEAAERALGDLPLVLEDLGDVRPPVRTLQRALGHPGMRVVQFALDGDPGNEHLPEHHPVASVSYVGTHDNDTALGWWNTRTPDERARIRRSFRDPGGDPVVELQRLALRSPAVWSVVTAQDVLGLGSEARTNTPGTTGGNWTWRLRPGTLDEGAAARVEPLVREAGRLPPQT
jgi:4-alpha-glucanotransferase